MKMTQEQKAKISKAVKKAYREKRRNARMKVRGKNRIAKVSVERRVDEFFQKAHTGTPVDYLDLRNQLIADIVK